MQVLTLKKSLAEPILVDNPNCSEGFVYSKNNHFGKGQKCMPLQRSEEMQAAGSIGNEGTSQSWGDSRFGGPSQSASLDL